MDSLCLLHARFAKPPLEQLSGSDGWSNRSTLVSSWTSASVSAAASAGDAGKVMSVMDDAGLDRTDEREALALGVASCNASCGAHMDRHDCCFAPLRSLVPLVIYTGQMIEPPNPVIALKDGQAQGRQDLWRKVILMDDVHQLPGTQPRSTSHRWVMLNFVSEPWAQVARRTTFPFKDKMDNFRNEPGGAHH